MTSLSRRSVRLVGLFGLFVAMSGAFSWSGAGWAQTTPLHDKPGQSIAQAENCQNAANAACANLCNPATNKTAEACVVCLQTHRDRCQGK